MGRISYLLSGLFEAADRSDRVAKEPWRSDLGEQVAVGVVCPERGIGALKVGNEAGDVCGRAFPELGRTSGEGDEGGPRG